MCGRRSQSAALLYSLIDFAAKRKDATQVLRCISDRGMAAAGGYSG
jgi:hypothetical protein